MTSHTIGRYIIERELGRGGTALAYLAQDPYMKRQVVVKLLLKQYLGDEEFLGRFRREAEVVAALEHPYIVPVYDFGEHEGQPFIVMRFMSGGSLRDRLSANPNFTPIEIATIIRRVAEALDEAHGRHVIHRDLKPANLLLDGRAQVYLADFGIAKMARAAQQMTMTGVVMGTPEYMSPEQALGQREIDERSDVYSLGVILFQLLTGDMPFKADTAMGVALAHVTAPVPSVMALKPSLDKTWQVVINMVLAKDPADRYATALQLSEAVTRVCAGAGANAPASVPAAKPNATSAPPPTTPLAPSAPAANPATRIQKLTRPGAITGPLTGTAPLPTPTVQPTTAQTPPRITGPLSVLRTSAPTLRANLPRQWPRQAQFPRLTVENAAGVAPMARWGKGRIYKLAFASDGSMLGVATSLGLYLLQPQSLNELWFADTPTRILSLAFSPDKRLMAAGGSDHTVMVWDGASGNRILNLPGHLDQVISLAFHPSGQWLASGSADGTVRVWDTVSGQAKHTLRGHTRPVQSLMFSPDGQWLASSGQDGTVNIWNANDGKQTRNLNFLSVMPPKVVYSSDNHPYVLGSFDNTIRLWDGQTGDLLQMFERHTSNFTDLEFNPDWTRVASGDEDGGVRVWDVASGRAFRTFESHTTPITSLAHHPTGTEYALFAASADGLLNVVNANTGQRLRRTTDFTPAITSLSLHPFERVLAIGGEDGAIRVVELSAGRALRTLTGHQGAIHQIAFGAVSTSPRRALLASSAADNAVRLWDVSVTQAVNVLKGIVAPVRALAFSADGQSILITDERAAVQIYEVRSAQLRLTLSGHTGPINAVAYSNDGRLVAGASDSHDVYVWDARTGKLVYKLEGHALAVNCVAFGPDGRWLVSGGDDRLGILWDLRTGKLARKLEGHTGELTAIAFSPATPQLIATASRDHTARLWNGATHQVLATLFAHNEVVNTLAFNSDGTLLLSGSGDGAVVVWAGQ